MILAVAAATAFLFAPARHEGWRLLRRTRWLMAVLLLTYAYSLPGIPLWPSLGWASPSVEGLQQGALRIGRLVLLLAGLAVLLAYTSRPRLIYGLYALARPLAWRGFDRRAFAGRPAGYRFTSYRVVAGVEGLEPPALGFGDRCSTN